MERSTLSGDRKVKALHIGDEKLVHLQTLSDTIANVDHYIPRPMTKE